MSDQDSSIFGNQPEQNSEAGSPESAPSNSFDDLLNGITNERGEKKYRDVPTALEALAASQEYIPSLHSKVDEQEKMIDTLRDELAKRQAVEEAIQGLQPPTPEPRADLPVGLDAAAAEALFEQKLSQHEQQQVRSKNLHEVTNSLKERYGEKAEEVFYKRGQELGLSPDNLNSLAGTSPAAVLAMFKPTSEGAIAPQESSVYVEPVRKKEVRLERNQTKSVLSGSTAAEVKAEYEYNKELVARIHAEGGTVEDLTDPKAYKKYFGNRE